MVSIVIPIYNPGAALKKCVESVQRQSFHDIEIILINDGSTDSSGAVCKEYATKDSRITYIEQLNEGVSASRNNGISKAKGEYITFIDSDDYVDENYIECMVSAIKRSNADIVIQGLRQIHNGRIIKTDAFECGVFHVSEISFHLFDKIFYYCGPYCKMFKTSIIKENNITFPTDLSYGEDSVFYHRYLEKCMVIELIPEISYNYTVGNQGALSTKLLHPDAFWQNQRNRRSAYLRLKNAYGLSPILSAEEQLCKMTGIMGMLNSIFKSGCDDETIGRYFDMIANDNIFGFSEIRGLTLKQKILLHLIKANNKASRRILKIVSR